MLQRVIARKMPMDPEKALAIVREIAAGGRDGAETGLDFRHLPQTLHALCIVVADLLAGTESGTGKGARTLENTPPRSRRPLAEYISRVEKEAIWEALQETGFNKTKAAELLGLTFRQLRYKLEIHQMQQPPKRRVARR